MCLHSHSKHQPVDIKAFKDAVACSLSVLFWYPCVRPRYDLSLFVSLFVVSLLYSTILSYLVI